MVISTTPSARPATVRAVAFCVPGWPPETIASGIVHYTHSLRETLKDRGVDVHVISQRLAKEFPTGGASRVHAAFGPAVEEPSLARRGLSRLSRPLARWGGSTWARDVGARIARAANRLSREEGLQLLQMEETAGWAYHVARLGEVPVVVRLHGPWFLSGAFENHRDESANLRRIRREGRAIAAAIAVTAPSRDVLDRTREFYGIPLPDARAIPIPMISPPPSARWRLDACDRERILFIGRFDNLKGGDVLIEAFRRVLERRPSVRLTFAGLDAGLEVDPARGKLSLREFVQERLPGALDDGRIEFTGRLAPAELDERRRGALATLVLSRYETFGNVLREAMILGCPVVSTDAGGLAEILDDGENALVVPPGDPDATAAAILRLVEAPEEAAALGARAAEACARRYHPDRIADETLEFYAEVIARHAASRRR